MCSHGRTSSAALNNLRLSRCVLRLVCACSAKEYETTCLNMIAKFKTLLGTMKEQVPDVQMFMRDFNMDCPAAYNRLIVSGMPATIEHGNCGCDSLHLCLTTNIVPRHGQEDCLGKRFIMMAMMAG